MLCMVLFSEAEKSQPLIERELNARLERPVRIKKIEPGLEDVFVELIGSWNEKKARSADSGGGP